MSDLPHWDVYNRMHSLDGRKEMMRDFVREFRQAQESDEMATDYQTEQEVWLVQDAMQSGLLPEKDDSLDETGYNTYFVKVFVNELEEALEKDPDEHDLQEMLQELQAASNPWKHTSDGSGGQWATCNRYRQMAVQWLLGGLDYQQEMLAGEVPKGPSDSGADAAKEGGGADE